MYDSAILSGEIFCWDMFIFKQTWIFIRDMVIHEIKYSRRDVVSKSCMWMSSQCDHICRPVSKKFLAGESLSFYVVVLRGAAEQKPNNICEKCVKIISISLCHLCLLVTFTNSKFVQSFTYTRKYITSFRRTFLYQSLLSVTIQTLYQNVLGFCVVALLWHSRTVS